MDSIVAKRSQINRVHFLTLRIILKRATSTLPLILRLKSGKKRLSHVIVLTRQIIKIRIEASHLCQRRGNVGNVSTAALIMTVQAAAMYFCKRIPAYSNLKNT